MNPLIVGAILYNAVTDTTKEDNKLKEAQTIELGDEAVRLLELDYMDYFADLPFYKKAKGYSKWYNEIKNK